MSAVYTRPQFLALVQKAQSAVFAYYNTAAHAGHSIDTCATALSLPYEVVYAAIVAEDLIILPNAAGEMQFASPAGKGPGQPPQ